MRSSQLLAVLGTAGLVLVGCGSRTVIHERTSPVVVRESAAQPIIVQSDTMPPPREEQQGTPPRAQDVWVAGHWEKTDRGWLWQGGHWEER